MGTQNLRLSRAKWDYVCALCSKVIKAGLPYFRDEPHPMARYHRGQKARYLCTVCAVGLNPFDLIKSPFDDSQQLRLPFDEVVEHLPRLLLQTAITPLGQKTDEGLIVQAVTLPWIEMAKQIEKDPRFLFRLGWRSLEEIIAQAYQREGWDEVTLTPSSGDGGRDIIAVKYGICHIRIIDQIKAYSQHRRVSANDVRALMGVLSSDLNVSKGFVTTTAQFAPRILEDPSIKPFIPYRLELRDGDSLRRWLIQVARKEHKGG
jgi:restriction system protein